MIHSFLSINRTMLRTLAVLAVAFVSTGSQSAEMAPLKLCFESAEVYPWRTTDRKGLNFELLNAAAKRANVQVTYLALPWKRCLAELKANTVDGAFAGSFSADRLAIGAYPGGAKPDAEKRLHMDSYVVVRRRGSAVTWDGMAFAGLTGSVGSQLGYSVGAQLKTLQVAHDEGSASAAELLAKLQAGRLGAAALLAGDARHVLAADAELARQLEVLDKPLIEKPYFLMLSWHLLETHPAIANRIWSAIGEVRRSEAYLKQEDKAMRGIKP